MAENSIDQRLEDQSISSESDVDINNIREDSDGWEDLEADEEQISVKDFFSDATFPSAKAMLEHSKSTSGLDLIQLRKQLDLDFLETIKLVNYIRRQVLDGASKVVITSKDAFVDDRYLQPVLEDDALLFSIGDVLEDNDLSQVAETGSEDVHELKERLAQLESQFSQYRADVAKTLDNRWDDNAATAGPSATTASSENERIDKKYDQGYFETYSYNEIHQVMLQDTIRTDAYRDFIYGNKHLFQGKTVLDVGCGTGILSMFCARAGAARVIAVDNSAIIDKTRAIIYANGLSDRITCVRGKIEEITLPDGIEQVDIIVSEWMGYCLLFEAMLDSVLFARDKYLRPDGLMVPSHCTLHLGALADPDLVHSNFDFWHDVYGFDMHPMREKIYDDVLVRAPEAGSIVARTLDRKPFRVLDLHSVTVAELDFSSGFEMKLDTAADALDGFCVWFDTIFLTERGKEVPAELLRGHVDGKVRTEGNVFFSTGPFTKQTHWQCGLCFINPKDKKERRGLEVGNSIKGTIGFSKHEEEKRGLKIDVDWSVEERQETGRQRWFVV